MSTWPKAYTAFKPEILGYLIRNLKNRDVAEDICQETFCKAIKADRQLRQEGNLRAYLFRIARNLMIDYGQKQKREALSGPNSAVVDIEVAKLPGKSKPETDYINRELGKSLQQQPGELSSDQKLAFELGVVLGLPYAEIAEKTGWNVGKVKITVFRARQSLMTGMRVYREEMA